MKLLKNLQFFKKMMKFVMFYGRMSVKVEKNFYLVKEGTRYGSY